jgi:hypothetical protein
MYLCGAKSFSKERMMLDYLALYESVKIIPKPPNRQICVVPLRGRYAQQRSTVQECDANEAEVRFKSRAHNNKQYTTNNKH